jgi:hypothetical protein
MYSVQILIKIKSKYHGLKSTEFFFIHKNSKIPEQEIVCRLPKKILEGKNRHIGNVFKQNISSMTQRGC